MLKKLQVRRKMLWKLLKTGQTCHNAGMQKNALEHATTHTTTRARGILGQAHLTTLLASKIRLALLVAFNCIPLSPFVFCPLFVNNS